MKASKISIGSLILILVSVAATYAQQSFIHTVTKDNTNCNTVCSVFDVPELNGNPNAVIFMWQVEFTENMGQVISSLKMTSKCTGETKLYKLDSNVRLSNK